jgi:type III pantothenate kinase
MLLTIDRGNSTLDVMLHGEGGRRARLSPGESLDAFLGAHRPHSAVAVTVVEGGLDGVAADLRRFGINLAIAGVDLPCPLPLDYATPATLGPDRWLSALAAHRRYGRSIVIDCGSATTVNLVEEDGTFCGGAIAPGLRAIVEGMAIVTPGLPRATPRAAVAFPPKSSADAVNTGALIAFCGAVERIVADTVAAARGPATVVLTGGHAEDYLLRGRLRPRMEPDLVHAGLHILAEEARWSC